MSALRPRRAAHLLRSPLPDGEAVVQVEGAERAILLNAVGDAVLDLCDGTRTAGEIAAILRQTLEVPAGVDVEADVERLIGELVDARILERT